MPTEYEDTTNVLKLKTISEDLKKALAPENNEDLYEDLTKKNKQFVLLQKNAEMHDHYVKKSQDEGYKSKKSHITEVYITARTGFFNKIQTSVKPLYEDIDRAIIREKNKNEKSKTYRALKIYLADLKVFVSKFEQRIRIESEMLKAEKLEVKTDLDTGSKGKTKVSKEQQEEAKRKAEDIEKKVVALVTSLRQIGTNMTVGVAVGIKFCKTTLADPTPASWNKINSDDGARALSQALTNIVKYCFTTEKELAEWMKKGKGADIELAAVKDPNVINEVKNLQTFLKHHKEEIVALGKESGEHALDGSIGFLANQKASHLPENASAQNVRDAVKHFSGLIKRADVIAQRLKKLGF